MAIEPNLTSIKVRRADIGGSRVKTYQVDPHWGIPKGQPPLFKDPTTGLARPFSSAVTLSTAVDNFIGFCNEWIPPGEKKSINVIEEGWVEFKLSTPTAVVPGDMYKPVVVTGSPNNVSDDTVEAASGPGDTDAIFEVAQDCACQPQFEPGVCLTDPPVASDVSPTSATRKVVRTATFYFNA